VGDKGEQVRQGRDRPSLWGRSGSGEGQGTYRRGGSVSQLTSEEKVVCVCERERIEEWALR
jgi:hypothetical protein